MFDVYLIADARTLGVERVPDAVERALGGLSWAGRVALQLRAKEETASVVRRLAHALLDVTAPRGVPLLINARLDLAREIAAQGVHLPEHGPSVAEARALLGAEALVGVSRHDVAGLARAAAEGANFATLSPVFDTPDKGIPLGVDGFAALVADAAGPLSVYALGGVRAEAVADLVRAGARGVAVIREVFGAPDPSARLAALCSAVASVRSQKLDTARRESGGLGS